MCRPLRPTTGSRHQCTSRTWRPIPRYREQEYGVREDDAHPLAPATGHDEVPLAANYQDGHHDDRIHDAQHYDDRLHGGDDAGPYYQDDTPLEPHEDEMYDDAPHARRHSGLVTALALIGCAVLGTAGAYAYRSYSGVPSSTQPPPVIAADNSTPTKIVPATAGDPQSSKAVQDRLATAEKEQLVSKQEEPVALSAPRPGASGPVRRHRPGLPHSRLAGRSPRRFARSPFARTETTSSGRPVGMAPPAARDLPRRRQPPRPDRPPRRPRRAPRRRGARSARRSRSSRRPASPLPRRPRGRAPRPYRLPPRARPMDSSCSFPHRRRRARRNPPSAACRQSSPTSLAAASRSFGERIWAAKACSTAP